MPETLSNSKFIELLDAKRQQLLGNILPLTGNQLRGIRKCSKLVTVDPETLRRNIPKKRAHTILSELWRHCKELFILCSLSTNQTTLGLLKTDDYLQEILTWWETVEHPKALTIFISLHQDILPNPSM
ncbi:hypothetical protein BDV35DRAFT_359648 [Aspergillus flavus]|uniref:Uncharacterized protein n=1 Tax=Aspergillus flavus TaxID=5059 RepID=A0A5N6GRY4_ASPFL|nr:hypothetical protein BDV35DRAFT_359648 [Aspergillus flavus]